MPIKISIVASMYNKKADTLEVIEKLFLPSLAKNASKDMEFILIDDCSPLSKETDLLVKKYAPVLNRKLAGFKYIKNKKNLGFAGSYNRGMKLAKGELIVMTNDDVYFTKDSIKNLCRTASSDDKIGAVGPVTNYATSYQNTLLFKRLKSYSPGEIKRMGQFAVRLNKAMAGKIYQADTLIGFCEVYKKSILKKIGYLDTRYKYGSFEEMDLNQRIKDSGYSLVIDAAVFVEHGGIKGGSGSLFQHKFRAIKSFVVNDIKFGIKHNCLLYVALIYPIISFIQMKDYAFTITSEIRKFEEERA